MTIQRAIRAIGIRVAGWAAAVLTAAVLGSIIQTQFNMAAIRALGAPLPVTTWLAVTVRDLLGFGPFYVTAVAVSFLVALTVAGVVARFVPAWRSLVFAAAGGVAIVVFLQVLATLAPADGLHIIAATRYVAGTLLLVAAGVAGGWVYARLTAGDAGKV